MTYLEACVDLANEYDKMNAIHSNAIRYARCLNNSYSLSLEAVYNKIRTDNGSDSDRRILLEAAAEDSANKIAESLRKLADSAQATSMSILTKMSTQIKSGEYQQMKKDIKEVSRADRKFKDTAVVYSDYEDAYKALNKLSLEIMKAIRGLRVDETKLNAWRQQINSQEINKKPRKPAASVNTLLKKLTVDEAIIAGLGAGVQHAQKSVPGISRKLTKQIANNNDVSSIIVEAWTVYNRAIIASMMLAWKQYVSEVAAIKKAVDKAKGSVSAAAKPKNA